MKSRIALAVALSTLFATGALAQATDAKVPTGIDVKGPTDYRLDGTKVVPIADRCDTAGLRAGLCDRAGTAINEPAGSEGASKGGLK